MSTSQSTAFIEKLFRYDNNIGHDDPQAEEKLRHKLKQLQDKQTMFKAINAINRKSKLTIQEKVSELVKLIGNDISRETALGLLQPDYCGRTGIPSYELTNNNGVINNVLERLAKIARVEAMPEFDEKRNGVRIYIDKDENRIFVDFKGRPSQEVIDHLKHYGFRWRPSEKVWSGNIDKYRLERAKKVWEMVPQEPMPTLQEIGHVAEANPDMSATDMIKLLSGEDQPQALVAPDQLAKHLPPVAAVERIM